MASYEQKQALNGRLAQLEAEINSIDTEIKNLKTARAILVQEKEHLISEINSSASARPGRAAQNKNHAAGSVIDYSGEFMEWHSILKMRMKNVFGIDNFRLCQQGVCNANMDGRDIVCVMPTGGGKSLTYQLPAIISTGCTLVISPLISLITDQILHLREAGVEAVMITGATSKEESRDIQQRLLTMARADGPGHRNNEIKLCYVTPEKIAKSKTFTSLLEKLATAGRLARIVIDEAHCVSELGHDFRPDYQKLNILRKLLPRVPILALSATCPPHVLQDLLKVLGLKEITDGNNAQISGTVYFSAPLYRKNLHYTVVPKPSSSASMIKTMCDYILINHRGHSGIIYCLSKADAENVARNLMSVSDGKIRTGVYHSEVKDHEKEVLHKRWRQGQIEVVCATIAFGLGIDKGNVRFVLHHSISKSIDGFYQESGRAGRDGQDSDCVLYYRPQDAARLSAIVCGATDGTQKLHDMLRFCQDMKECRKIQFAHYFSASSNLSMSSWTTDDTDALARCGHCDNCTRRPELVDHREVTLEAWQILKVAFAVEKEGGRLTMSMLADLVRGNRGGSIEVGRGKGKGKRNAGGGGKEKVDLDLNAVAGGKVGLSKDDTETLIINLLLSSYLEESYSQTAYSINVYVKPGPLAVRLTRLARNQVENDGASPIHCSFRRSASSSTKRHDKDATINSKPKRSKSAANDYIDPPSHKSKHNQKRKRGAAASEDSIDGDDDDDDDDDDEIIVEDDIDDVDDHDELGAGPARTSSTIDAELSANYGREDDNEEEEDIVVDQWSFSYRTSPTPKRRKKASSRAVAQYNDVVELSSD